MKNHTQLLEAYQHKGIQLAEKWSRFPGGKIKGYPKKVNFLEGIPKDDIQRRALLGQLYENTYKWLDSLEESTRTLNVGSFEKFVFPIVRAVMANLVLSDLVTVSPLDAPTGLIFYMEALYGSSKGNISRGTRMYDARRGPSTNFHFTDEIIEEEPVGTGDAANAAFAGNAAYIPVRPGTVVFGDGTQRVSDDGNGNLQGDCAAGGTIDYTTGAYTFTFTNAPGAGEAVVVSYEYNSEANAGTPELDLHLTSSPVTARTNKLRCRYSVEAQQDFQAYHGISAEVEIVAFMANEISKELNYKGVRHIRQIASAGNSIWDRTPPAGVPWLWHRESLYDALVACSNLIFARTQRVGGTWVVASTDVCNVIETLSKFQPQGGSSQGAGVRKIGKIGEFDVYKDPTYPDNEFLMGHKSTNWLDTGYVWAPYLAPYTTGTIVLDDMIARKGMAQRSALKVVNSGMYARGSVTQTGGAFVP